MRKAQILLGKIPNIIVCVFKYIFILLVPKKNKSILLIPHHIDIGGTSTHFYYLLEYFLSNGLNVNILVKKNEISSELVIFCDEKKVKIYRYDKQLNHIEHIYSWDHSLAKYFILDFISQLDFYLRILIKTRSKYVLVSPGHPYTGLISTLYLPINVLYIVHGIPWSIDKGNKFLLKNILGNRKQIVTVSEFCRNEIIKVWDLANKSKYIHVVYNYFEKKYNYPIKRETSNKLTVLTIGTVTEGKNPELWIDIAKKVINTFKDLEIDFLWLGDGVLFDKCLKKITSYKNIHFLGFKEDVEQFYANSDIYLQPSNRESHGIAVIGAMAYKLPCIVTNYGGTIESIENGSSGYHVNITNDEIFEKLSELILDSNLRCRMGENAYQRYNELFTKEIWNKKMDSLIRC